MRGVGLVGGGVKGGRRGLKTAEILLAESCRKQNDDDDDCFYIVLFFALEQTHCARM